VDYTKDKALVLADEILAHLTERGYAIVPIPPARGEAMPKTIDHYKANAIRDMELIMEQKAEIEKLKQTVNQLRQKS
jgi:hypothetical protein